MFGTQVKYYELWFAQLFQIISEDFAVYIWTNYWERAVPALSVDSRNLPIKLGKISFKIHEFYNIKSQPIWKRIFQMIIDLKNEKQNVYALLVIFTSKIFEIQTLNKDAATAVSKKKTYQKISSLTQQNFSANLH